MLYGRLVAEKNLAAYLKIILHHIKNPEGVVCLLIEENGEGVIPRLTVKQAKLLKAGVDILAYVKVSVDPVVAEWLCHLNAVDLP